MGGVIHYFQIFTLFFPLQISIKLLIYYEKTYKYIYTSVMKFVQNPFARENMRDWESLEELLIASCLVGIPWATLREAFARRLFHQVFISFCFVLFCFVFVLFCFL